MPVVSKAQGAYLGIHHPEVLRKWKAEGASTSTKDLPEHVAKKKRRPFAVVAAERIKGGH